MKLKVIENGFCEAEYEIIRDDGRSLIVSASDLKELYDIIRRCYYDI
jgi:hypothetical protein